MYRTFTSPGGLTVLVGRCAKENEALAFGVAHADDVWLHADGVPGSHVVLRTGGAPADKEDVQFAADLAARYSSARDRRVVPVTRCRAGSLRKPRKSPLGTVTVGPDAGVVRGHPGRAPSPDSQ